MTSNLVSCWSGAAFLALACSATAYGDDTRMEPILDLRLRAEQVDQAGLENTTAVTLRGRFGFQLQFLSGWSFLAEAEAVEHLGGDFSDTVNTIGGRAVVADPEAFELNRFQVSWTGETANLTLGRQRIVFDDARLVGNVGFRQNEQTFDAVRVGYTGMADIAMDYVYVGRVHRIFGDDSPMGEFESDSHIFRIGAETPAGEISASILLLDFENAPAASSQTYSLRWSESWTFEAGTFGATAQLALQDAYRGGGPASELGFQSVGATFTRGDITAFAGADVLEGSGGQAFSTPLATLHAFQGWADVFLTTPGQGLRDLSFGIRGRGVNIVSGAPAANWAVVYHDFESDNGSVSFGREFDAVFRVPVNDWLAVELKGARFEGEQPAFPDRTKIWLSIEANF